MLNNIINITPPPGLLKPSKKPWPLHRHQVPHQHCSVLLLPPCNSHLEYDPTTHYWNRKSHSFSSSNNEPPLHKQTSYNKQTNKHTYIHTYIQPNACTQEALQTPALAQVWAVWSKQPETWGTRENFLYPVIFIF